MKHCLTCPTELPHDSRRLYCTDVCRVRAKRRREAGDGMPELAVIRDALRKVRAA